MVPTFFTGLRLGMTGVLLGVLLAELYVSTAGIGYFTSIFTQNLDPTKLIGLVSMLARDRDRAQRNRAPRRSCITGGGAPDMHVRNARSKRTQ